MCLIPLNPTGSLSSSRTIPREVHYAGKAGREEEDNPSKVKGLQCNSKEGITGRDEGPSLGGGKSSWRKIMGLLRVDTHSMAHSQSMDQCKDEALFRKPIVLEKVEGPNYSDEGVTVRRSEGSGWG